MREVPSLVFNVFMLALNLQQRLLAILPTLLFSGKGTLQEGVAKREYIG
jgi:hypothetical protein